mgnify:FL=1
MPGTIHVYTFVKGGEKLMMVYTSDGLMDIDAMAPMDDGWQFDSDFDIPAMDVSYDDVKAL